MKTFEETIMSILNGDTRKNALDFTAFLEANDMTTGENHSTIIFGGDVLAYMHMDGKAEMPGPWTIWPSASGNVADGFIFDDTMKQIAHAHVNICGECGGKCAPGSRKSVYGKEFDNVCGAMLAFTDPSSDALACVKKILEMIKHEINNR